MIYDYKNYLIYNSLDDDSIHISKTLLDQIGFKEVPSEVK